MEGIEISHDVVKKTNNSSHPYLANIVVVDILLNWIRMKIWTVGSGSACRDKKLI